jgi:hypothetical protein
VPPPTQSATGHQIRCVRNSSTSTPDKNRVRPCDDLAFSIGFVSQQNRALLRRLLKKHVADDARQMLARSNPVTLYPRLTSSTTGRQCPLGMSRILVAACRASNFSRKATSCKALSAGMEWRFAVLRRALRMPYDRVYEDLSRSDNGAAGRARVPGLGRIPNCAPRRVGGVREIPSFFIRWY